MYLSIPAPPAQSTVPADRSVSSAPASAAVPPAEFHEVPVSVPPDALRYKYPQNTALPEESLSAPPSHTARPYILPSGMLPRHDWRHDLPAGRSSRLHCSGKFRAVTTFFIIGIVTEPVVTVFPTEDPIPSRRAPREITATFAGPPAEEPQRQFARSIKNSGSPSVPETPRK